MEKKEKAWRTAEIVIGAIGAALLLTILILRLLKLDVLYLTYPLVGLVILFLISDDRARSFKRKRLKEQAAAEENTDTQPEDALPREAFEFDEKQP